MRKCVKNKKYIKIFFIGVERAGVEVFCVELFTLLLDLSEANIITTPNYNRKSYQNDLFCV